MSGSDERITEIDGIIEEFRKARDPQAIGPSALIAVSWGNKLADAYEDALALVRSLREERDNLERARADWQTNCRYIGLERNEAEARAAHAEQALRRAKVVAENLHGMIDRETWRAHGGDDGQGHYEGDYHAEQIYNEIKSWGAALSAGEETRAYPRVGPVWQSTGRIVEYQNDAANDPAASSVADKDSETTGFRDGAPRLSDEHDSFK